MTHTRISLYAYAYMSILVCIYSYMRIIYMHITCMFWSLISELHCTVYLVLYNDELFSLAVKKRKSDVHIHKVVLLEKSGVHTVHVRIC